MEENENKNSDFVKYLKIGAVIAAVFVVFTEFKKCNHEKDRNSEIRQEQAVTPEENLSRERAFYATKDCVGESLPKADSLVFPAYNDPGVSVTSDKNIYTVTAPVEEINKSASPVQHRYKAEVEKIEEREWKCLSITIEN
ncbi:MAG: hypothetical protein FWF54_03815 [Candidatus Azobacteroides sp.]|nr:hypothetical protein [Candidatus Azobacteroides sp.]